MLTVDSTTGRVKIPATRTTDAEARRTRHRQIQYGLGQQAADKSRDIATADLEGDGLTDVVVADPRCRSHESSSNSGRGMDSNRAKRSPVWSERNKSARPISTETERLKLSCSARRKKRSA